MVLRFRFIIGACALFYGALLFHLYQLQIVKGEYYLAKAESQYLAGSFLNAQRGTIFFTDKEGRQFSVAFNKNVPTIYAVPSRIDDAEEAAERLSPVLDIPAENLKKAFANKKDPYEVLARKASRELVSRVEELGIKGIDVEISPSRFYPFGQLASHVLGFVGPSEDSFKESGHYGIEEVYDAELAASLGDASSSKRREPKTGDDVELTIDLNIQKEAEKILDDLISKHDAEEGTIIVAEPKTGKILALANLPSFDPNQYSAFAVDRFFSSAVQGVYEPGSVFKVITMAAGIDAGKITPETTYYDTGSVTLNGRTINNHDFKAYGTTSMSEVIEHSLNTGSVFAQRRMGREVFTKYLKDFGFDQKTGVDLLGEVKGNLKQLTPNARDVAFATASFGQGVAVTPMELISAISALANEGRLMRPFLNVVLEPQMVRRAVSKETARQVVEMMVLAVDKAAATNIRGFTVAGKTGTAFVPDFKKGGYTEDVINTYVGFAPAHDARFIALVKLVKPKGSPLASASVVPAFKELAQFIINYYRIEPDRLPSQIKQ